VIPSSVEILGAECFLQCDSLSSITFESNSRLTTIEALVFASTSAQSIVLPRSVRFIDGSAFCHTKFSSVLIEGGGDAIIYKNDFLIDVVNHKLIRDFARGRIRTIPKDIEIIGSCCFAFSFDPQSLKWESYTRLIRIESQAFALASIESIVIPSSVEVLCSSCFADCTRLSSISFKSPSKLKRIESRTFDGVPCKIVLPCTVCFVASDVSSTLDQLSLEKSDSARNFDGWIRLRKSEVDMNFRTILTFKSGLPDLKYFRLNDSVIKKSWVKTENEIFRRLEDNSSMVAQSISKSQLLKSDVIQNEIGKILSLRHPCIASPIAFVFPSGSENLRIVRLYSDSGSLAEVLRTKPVWWTVTAKVKAIVGLLLGLRFAHSFGLIHGHLTADNIVFDSDHQIQITDFLFGLSGQAHPGFSNEKWSPQADIDVYVSLLFDIVAGLPIGSEEEIPDGVTNLFYQIMYEVPKHKSRTEFFFQDILVLLRDQHFKILEGVDIANVWAFVNWVEAFEQSSE
jgi:hypothetical protein